jgi:ubiquinone/menaquinone biosynthesis C-methylase UbiE
VEQIKKYSSCPVCEGKGFSNHLTLLDHMITQDVFTIVRCDSCGFHFTNPIPSEEVIGSYYKSENYISHSSSKTGLINKAYNVVRNITLKRKVNLVSRLAKGKNLLDVGSGTGHFLNASKGAGFIVQGLDPDEDAKNFAKSEFSLALQDLNEISQIDSNSKDVITMWHVLEHVYHLKRDLSEFVRVLNEEGVFIVAVPNMSSWDAKHYGAFWAAYDVPRHLYHFQEPTIKNLFAQFDLKCVEILPMKFDSFYVSMLSEKYKSGNIVSGVLNGLKSNLKAKNNGYSSQIYVFKKNKAI